MEEATVTELAKELQTFFDEVWSDQGISVLLYSSAEHNYHFTATKSELIDIFRASIEA